MDDCSKFEGLQHSVSEIQKGVTTDQILSEYELITKLTPRDVPCSVGMSLDNIDKNRWRGFIAYDDSRVVLRFGSGSSDYINANYLPDYSGNAKAIIATQGPLECTVNDFWRMVWQEGANRIVMTTKLKEPGAKFSLCAKYWPDQGSKTYGDVDVTLTGMESHPHFVIRFLNASIENETRTIVHFQYLGWPDREVPHSPASLLTFWQAIQKYSGTAKTPTISHCSAGVGRTGTYLALDQVIQQARTSGHVRVCDYVMQMRRNRYLMVQKYEQYDFVYKALKQAFGTQHILEGDIQQAEFGQLDGVFIDGGDDRSIPEDLEASR